MKRITIITKIIVVSLICLLASTTARAELFSEEQESLEELAYMVEEQPDEQETEPGSEKPEFPSRSYDLDSTWVEFIQGLNDMVMQDQDQDLFEGALVIDLEEKTVLNAKQEEVFECSELVQQVLEQDAPEAVQAVIDNSEYQIYQIEGSKVVLTDASMIKLLIVEVDELTEDYGAVKVLPYHNFYILRYDTPEDTRFAYEQFLSNGSVISVGYDQLLKPENAAGGKCLLNPEAGSVSLMSSSYDDWGSELMGIDEMRDNLAAHPDSFFHSVVAVIDHGGFDWYSLDSMFPGRVHEGRNYYDYNNQVLYNDDIYPPSDHGTLVSSIILKSTPENIEVLPIKIYSYLSAVAGIGYAVLNDAAVVNMSFFGDTDTHLAHLCYSEAVNDALSNSGDHIVFIASSGNVDEERYNYPASTPYVISVGGIQKNGAGVYGRWIGSNPNEGSTYNNLVDFCAPGKDIQAFSGTMWSDYSGTSFAAPYISAAVAMVLMVEPTYTRDDVYDILVSLAQDLGSTGKDKYYGWGYVNLSDFIDSYPVTNVSLSPSSTTIATQATRNISATITPLNAIDQTLQWSSANSSVASVNQNGKVTGNSYGQTTITALAIAGLASATSKVTVRYRDVNDASKYYFRPVYWMAYNSITGGTNGNATFSPDNNCTRAQLAEFFWKLAGTPAPGITSSPFSDVNNTTTHHSAIYWAYNNNIIGGYADGTFRPDIPCTRIQTVLMLWRFAGMPNVEIGLLPFDDIGSLSTNQLKAVIWANDNHIAGGYQDGTFRPTENSLRKHIATFLYKYARSGITKWTCLGCGAQYSNEPNAETHYLGIMNHAEHFAGQYNPETGNYSIVSYTLTRPFRVGENIYLTGIYYGFSAWGIQ